MIPAEAVEAAAIVLWDKEMNAPWSSAADGFKAPFLRDARAALEAAAQHIRAQVLLDAAETLDTAPPMIRAQYVATLRLYAVEPWRLMTCPSVCAATNHPSAEHGEVT